ncbi:DUF397 domain-containing protein [Nocardia yunnanensis]|uniref:DUF397 domain-containing protein n=1 Tax=Nocardia yunnanensis TaxID=2382165 RepID=A0A386ZFK2_9NOCA|nr:DUF397 domain-containing protein [Nocardia yunnanensis]AYF76308.1 DUF397 domain-containing protein [Nocardia yunnanensis]
MASVDQAGTKWFKSTYSEGGSQCVEVAWLDGGQVGVRDSKNPTGPSLMFTPGAWDAFTASIREGRFKRPV